MDTRTLLLDLFRHMEWADALAWVTVLPNPTICDDSDLHDRLYHLHMVQWSFLDIWRGERLNYSGTESLRGTSLAEWGHAYHTEVASFLRTLEPSRLDDVVRLPWASRVMAHLGTSLVNPSLGETLVQVTAHSTYHRGQVSARIRALGVVPPLTDFIAWVWSGKPAPSWPTGTE